MRETYEKPIATVNEFKSENVITTSSGKIGTTTSGWVDKWY